MWLSLVFCLSSGCHPPIRLHTTTRLIVVLVAAAAAAVAVGMPVGSHGDEAAQAVAEGLRMVRWNATRAAWLSLSEIDELVADGGAASRFVDVTESEGLGKGYPVAVAGKYVFPAQPMHKAVVGVLANKVEVSAMVANVETFSSFYTRYYTSDTGRRAAEWVHDLASVYAGAHPGITVEYFANSFLQPSVIVTIAGQTSDIVILGAHIDSVGSSSTGRAPGVDDDGSGTVTLLETLRILAAAGVEPYNTIQLQFYAAEEVGLRGSAAIANKYASEGKTIVGMAQFDMTCYDGSSAVPTVGIVTDYTSAPLNAFLRLLVDAYTLEATWTDTKCGYRCSDHASWTSVGVDAVFPFEAEFTKSNPFIHGSTDTLDHCSEAHMRDFARLAIGFAIELSLLQPQP
ncbi:uncharacterized protein AMSG_12257 [Thecamonas trahens ATCC 50062]|uniref:Peptidase M28 domain-containing protein n=1 Tax=Thecamonas trahens ATCC 50062 TaxID=461836 RepID=A0A0L0DL84_THETB|nr:hypothetical protein AMSG_12257 [Thecamonas trahens ATCC 50062]KNC53089.1 hypothetical protein AMSG_12257 [Thecamonas trahens ATCC 50062]|eukprot:XP_013754805.1 hypothetical protein AMSG_12257 [Thecamonas trahens ATCC 50062]